MPRRDGPNPTPPQKGDCNLPCYGCWAKPQRLEYVIIISCVISVVITMMCVVIMIVTIIIIIVIIIIIIISM